MITRVRIQSQLLSFVFFAALVGLPALAGYLAAGPVLAVALTVFVVASGYAATHYAERYVLASHGAEPLHPYDAPDLFRLMQAVSARAGIEAPRLYLVDSGAPNAFAVGRPGHRASVAVTTALLRKLDARELAGVLAHEAAHIRHGDVVFGAVAATVTTFFFSAGRFVLPAALLTLPLLIAFAPMLLLAALVVLVAPVAALLLQAAHARQRELAADAEASRITGDPLGLAAALQRLRPRRHTWLSLLFGLRPELAEEEASPLHSHPPTRERIDRLLVMANRG